MTGRIGIAMVGLGPGSEPHVKSLLDLRDRVDVRWAVSSTTARWEAFAKRAPFPLTTDLAAAVTDPTVGAVLVLTPPSSHLLVAEMAFAAGKHVLVEKPLELTVAAGERLVATGRAAHRHLGVVLQQRFRPAGLRLRALLAEGRLGTVEQACMHVPWWRPQAYYDEPGRGSLARDGGGVLLTQAIHTLNMFLSLVGGRRVVAAQVGTTALHRMETEDYAHALIELGNGKPGVIAATTAAYAGRRESIEIVGTNGTAVLEGASLRAKFLDGTEESLLSEEGTGGGGNIMDFPHDAHRAVIADFLDAIETGRDPVVTGEDALATQRFIAAILAAGRDRRDAGSAR